MNERQPFNGRGFTSFVVLFSFLIMLLSGIMLYLSPRGRVANWTGWTMWGLEKHEWESLHLTMALAMLAGAGFHIYFNWSYLVRYIKDAAQSGMRSKRELGLASLVVVLLFAGTQAGVPPFSLAGSFGDQVKDFWEVRSSPAPYAHAEESSLTEFARNTSLELDEVSERLRAAGISVYDPAASIRDLAATHGRTPDEMYKIMLPDQRFATPAVVPGLGRMTLQEACAALDMDPALALELLAQNGIHAKLDEMLRDLAEANGRSPQELVSLFSADRPEAQRDPVHLDAAEETEISDSQNTVHGRIQGEARGRGNQRGNGYGQGYGRGQGRQSGGRN
ncbi:MAG: DUF4405 domain-containing protein [Candidatus Hydrogenedentes bacterium]|nr:DUF4405 domain-containing protein [Candidatus Hydrogenedentota bacterium]